MIRRTCSASTKTFHLGPNEDRSHVVEAIVAPELSNTIHLCRYKAGTMEAMMGKLYEHITDRLEAFIERQHVFFVATAPLEESGHVNVSPKGQDTFAVLDPHTVAYQDFSGSGAET